MTSQNDGEDLHESELVSGVLPGPAGGGQAPQQRRDPLADRGAKAEARGNATSVVHFR